MSYVPVHIHALSVVKELFVRAKGAYCNDKQGCDRFGGLGGGAWKRK